MRSKHGQTLGLSILNALAIFIIGLMFVNFFFAEITDFRVNLNCADASSIHDGNKLMCLIAGDLVIPLLIWGVISLGIGAIISRVVL